MSEVVAGHPSIQHPPLQPEWLIGGFLTDRMTGLRVQARLQSCQEHLSLFGMEISFEQGGAPPIKYRSGSPAIWEGGYGMPPVRLRVVG